MTIAARHSAAIPARSVEITLPSRNQLSRGRFPDKQNLLFSDDDDPKLVWFRTIIGLDPTSILHCLRPEQNSREEPPVASRQAGSRPSGLQRAVPLAP